MTIEIVDASHGVLTVRMSGVQGQRELIEAQKSAAQILQNQGKMRLLILADQFEGWSKEDDWGKGGDLTFLKNDQSIEKMAIVGDKEWEADALIFVGKGFRRFPIEYFPSADLVKAREWLAENP